jgi:glutaconate CoA-transferase subunit A
MGSGYGTSGKERKLKELVALVPNGASLALGGSFLHRGPFAFVRELIRQGKTDLEIIKQSPGYDIDILCRAYAVKKVRAGIVAMEGNFGLAPYYRRAIESGDAELEEHACASLTAGLRAAGCTAAISRPSMAGSAWTTRMDRVSRYGSFLRSSLTLP